VEKPPSPLLGTLSAAERIAKYREYAKQALKRALNTQDPEQRARLLSAASDWHIMAIKAQKNADQPEQIIPAVEDGAGPSEPGLSPKEPI
jgi:hypothetical protein